MGVEPTHGLRRLTDFESAPLDHLGTFPRKNNEMMSRHLHKEHLTTNQKRNAITNKGNTFHYQKVNR